MIVSVQAGSTCQDVLRWSSCNARFDDMSIIDNTSSGVVQRPLRFTATSMAPPVDIIAQRLSGVADLLVAWPHSTIDMAVRRVATSVGEEEVCMDVMPHVARHNLGRQLRHLRSPVVAVGRKQRIKVFNYSLPRTGRR